MLHVEFDTIDRGSIYYKGTAFGAFKVQENVCKVVYAPVLDSEILDTIEFTVKDKLDTIEAVRDLIPCPIKAI